MDLVKEIIAFGKPILIRRCKGRARTRARICELRASICTEPTPRFTWTCSGATLRRS